MPLMAAVKAVCLQVDGWRPWGLLMGSGDQPDDNATIKEAEKATVDEERAAAMAHMDPEKTVIMESPIRPAK